MEKLYSYLKLHNRTKQIFYFELKKRRKKQTQQKQQQSKDIKFSWISLFKVKKEMIDVFRTKNPEGRNYKFKLRQKIKWIFVSNIMYKVQRKTMISLIFAIRF